MSTAIIVIMNAAKLTKDMTRLEEARSRSQERFEKQQKRIAARYESMQKRLGPTPGDPSNTQQKIIQSALDLLKEDGLANITLRKIATKTNMKAPALYWHFKSKEVLVDYMAEAILEKEFKEIIPKTENESWQDWLTDHMYRLRRAMLEYPDGARVVAGAHLDPAATLANSIEYSLISLKSAGIDPKVAIKIIWTATTYTFGFVIEEQSAPREDEIKDFDFKKFLKSYPNMASALNEDRSREALDKYFMEGLQIIISGAELSLIRKR